MFSLKTCSNVNNSCGKEEKNNEKVSPLFFLILVLLAYYIYLLQNVPKPTPTPPKPTPIPGKDGTLNFTILPYNVNIPGTGNVIEKLIQNQTEEVLFTVPVNKRYLVVSLSQYNTSAVTASTNSIFASSPSIPLFRLDQTTINPQAVPYAMNFTLMFEEGEQMLWKSLAAIADLQIVKIFVIELEKEKNVPLFSFKKVITTTSPLVDLYQSTASGPALLISGFNGFQFFNYNQAITGSTSMFYSSSTNPSTLTANTYFANAFVSSEGQNYKVSSSGGSVIFNSGAPSPSSLNIHVINYGVNGQAFILGPSSTVFVGPVSPTNVANPVPSISVFGTFYQF